MSKKYCIVIALSLVAILLGTTAIYWQGLDGPFLLDDYTNIVNSYVADFDVQKIIFAVTHNESGTLGRPVSVLSLIFSGIVHGPEPWGYKLHNLVIHLINGLLIFWLLQKLLCKVSRGQDKEKYLFVAGMTSAIWLLHPLMVSTVLYAVQRMAQLATMFTLTSLLIFVSLRENEASSARKFYPVAYVLFPISLLMAIFSKENGALIPLYILAIEFIVFQFGFSTQLERKRIYTFEGVFVYFPIIVAGLYTLTHLDTLTNYATRNFDMGERLLTQLHVVVSYLKMILLPRLSDMALFHDYIEITRSFDPATLILLVSLILAVFLIFLLRKKAPIISLAIAWFLVSHMLESTIFSLELMFEHRNYLAAVGPILALVYYLGKIPDMPKFKYFNILILVLMGFITVLRVQEWGSEENIYRVAVAEHPDSPRAQTQMAIIEYGYGNYAETLRHLNIVQELLPTDFGPVILQATFLCSTGNDLTPLIDKAADIAGQYPITPYGLNALNTIITSLSDAKCPEISPGMLLPVIEAAKNQSGNRLVDEFLAYLEDIEGSIYLLLGNYQKGMGLKLSAFQRSGYIQILEKMTAILLENDRLIEAEQIIGYIAILNTQSHGVETAVLEPLQEKLAIAKSKGIESE